MAATHDSRVDDTGSVVRRLWGRIVPALLVPVLVFGCSEVPYAPGPTFEPSPTPAPRQSSATSGPPTTETGPAIELEGAVVADNGQTATLTARVELGDIVDVHSDPTHDRLTQRLDVHGSATLTNPTSRINVAASAVDLVFQSGYPRSSPACAALPAPEGVTWGAYCWYLLGATSAFGEHGDIIALQPGERRVRAVTTMATGLSRLRVPEAAAKRAVPALKHPAVVVVLTSAVDYNGTRLRGGCGSRATVVTPSGPAAQTPRPAQPVLTQNAVAATTSTIACKDIQYIGP